MVGFEIRPGQKPTQEQLVEIEEAKKKPVFFDEDCLELSDETIESLVELMPGRHKV